MKKQTLIVVVLLVLPLMVFGQNKIYNATELKRGIYKTYEEFINNAPSITNEFTVKDKSTARGGSPFDFQINDGTKVGKVYGFCDGKNVYLKGLRMGGYCKVDYIGRYSFFTYVTHGAGFTAMAVPDHLLIVGDAGKYLDGTVNFVSKFIREKNPALADEFDKLDDKKSKRQEYLIRLNEFLKTN